MSPTEVTLDPASAPQAVQAWLDGARPAIDAELTRRLAWTGDDPGRLREAMRYAALGPGKRLRPALVLAACEAVQRAGAGTATKESGAPEASEYCTADSGALAAAAALEMLHAYTLVHDDLPAMDDDDERRGRPTVHIEFGEAIAILAGDGLLTAAFGALAELGPRAGAAVEVLARRSGAGELLGGQAIDLAMEKSGAAPVSLVELERLHAGKTGALFAAAAELGGIAGGADADARARLARYGLAVGIAFQHADDRDDQEFCDLATVAAARMRELCDEAIGLARSFGPGGRTLEALAAWIGARS